MLRLGSGEPVVSEQQYAVVLVNEDQLDKLLHRPTIRQVGRRGIQTIDLRMRYARMRPRTAAIGVLVIILTGAAVMWLSSPSPASAAKTSFTPTDAPTLATAASFSITATTGQRDAEVKDASERIRRLGYPVFVRAMRDGGVRQVMVGPYASLDEAEAVQRRIGAAGFRGARVFVDDTLRHSPRNDRRVEVPEGNPNVVLVGAPDRLALVLELPFEPRQVGARRPDGSTIDIDVGPMPTPIRGQQWSAPGGTDLIRQVSIEELNEDGNGRFLRAHLALPEFARPAVRAEGRRIYIDLTWADDAPERLVAEGQGATPSLRAAAEGQPAAAAVAANAQGSRAAIDSAVSRFEEVAPFVLRAAETPSPEVLSALAETLASLDSSLSSMTVPRDAATDHARISAAVRAARRAMDPAFTGDRLAQAHQAVGSYRAGVNAPVTITPAAQ